MLGPISAYQKALMNRLYGSIKDTAMNAWEEGGQKNQQLLSDLHQVSEDPFNQQGLEAGRRVSDQTTNLAMGTIGVGENKTGKLAMDEASRLARAKEMGFDTGKTYYHGTAAGPFNEFHESNYPGIAAFVTENKDFAEKFASDPYYSRGLVQEGMEEPYVHELLVNAKNPFDYENPEHVRKIVSSLPKSKRAELLHGSKYRRLEDALSSGDFSTIEEPAILDLIKKAGFDAAHVAEDGQKNLALFKSNQLRRPAARFDPNKSGSGDLAAGLGGVVGAAALSKMAKDREPPSY